MSSVSGRSQSATCWAGHYHNLVYDLYRLPNKELDFIINYNVKYRMGDELLEDEETG